MKTKISNLLNCVIFFMVTMIGCNFPDLSWGDKIEDQKFGSLTVTVIDSMENPMKDVTIMLSSQPSSSWAQELNLVQTDENGIYVYNKLPMDYKNMTGIFSSSADGSPKSGYYQYSIFLPDINKIYPNVHAVREIKLINANTSIVIKVE